LAFYLFGVQSRCLHGGSILILIIFFTDFFCLLVILLREHCKCKIVPSLPVVLNDTTGTQLQGSCSAKDSCSSKDSLIRECHLYGVFPFHELCPTPVGALPPKMFPHEWNNNHGQQQLQLLDAFFPLLLGIRIFFIVEGQVII